MDRKTFFQYAFRKVVGKGLDMVADSPAIAALERMADDVDDGRKKERPPGAAEEQLFLERCTGCDQCMVACPVNVIMIEDLEARVPLIYPDESPCIHCAGYPCIAVCPTGALSIDNQSSS